MQLSIEKLHKRNNVESIIFNLYCKLRNGKSKYLRLEKKPNVNYLPIFMGKSSLNYAFSEKTYQKCVFISGKENLYRQLSVRECARIQNIFR